MNHDRQKRKTIWHLHSNRWNSAITEYMVSAARGLRLIGTNNIVSPLRNSPAEQRVLSLAFTVHSVDNFALKSWKPLLSIGRQLQPDIVISYGGPETSASAFLSRSLGAEFFRFRGQPPRHGGHLASLFDSFVHGHVKKIICPSLAVLKGEGPRARGKSEIVPIGIDDERFKRTASLHTAGRPELVIFGRLDPVKGHRRSLEIFKHVLDQWPDDMTRPILRVVGKEANTKIGDLREFQGRIGILPSDVDYVGEQIDDVADLMTRATLGWVSSIGSEFICRVAEEFLLCGTPLFVSGVGALDEINLPGSVTSYHELTNEEAAQRLLNWTLLAYQEDPVRRRIRAEEASRLFSITAMADQLAMVLGV